MTKAVATIPRCNVLTEQNSFNRTTGDDIYTLVARMRWTRKRLVVVSAFPSFPRAAWECILGALRHE